MNIKLFEHRWKKAEQKECEKKYLFQSLSFDSQAKIFDYVTPGDLLELSIMSKKTREYMINTKVIWIPMYKKYVSSELPKDMNLLKPLLEKYKQEKGIKEDNLERDRKLGAYGIIQEEFLFAIFVLPKVISWPHKAFGN